MTKPKIRGLQFSFFVRNQLERQLKSFQDLQKQMKKDIYSPMMCWWGLNLARDLMNYEELLDRSARQVSSSGFLASCLHMTVY